MANRQTVANLVEGGVAMATLCLPMVATDQLGCSHQCDNVDVQTNEDTIEESHVVLSNYGVTAF